MAKGQRPVRGTIALRSLKDWLQGGIDLARFRPKILHARQQGEAGARPRQPIEEGVY